MPKTLKATINTIISSSLVETLTPPGFYILDSTVAVVKNKNKKLCISLSTIPTTTTILGYKLIRQVLTSEPSQASK